ncbi:MAG: hypothetical protein QM731_09670 [Chitinophagaceae bacterium]
MKTISEVLVLSLVLSGCLLFKGAFTEDGSAWIWNKDPSGRYNRHNPLQPESASKWIDSIRAIPTLRTLQVEVMSHKWDHYNVNDSGMFFNLQNKELANYHSYYTFANRMGIAPEQLKKIVLDFDKLGLNRFYRENEFIAFETMTSLTYAYGYFYFFDTAAVKRIHKDDVLDFRSNGEFTNFRQAMFNRFLVLKVHDSHWVEWMEVN